MTATVTPIRRESPADRYLEPGMVQEIVPGLTADRLRELRKEGRGPAYSKPTGERGRLIYYTEKDVRAWVAAGRTSTREQR